MIPNDNVSMSVRHLDHVLTVYSSMQHVTCKSLVPCVAEMVGSCIPIHAYRHLPNPKCLFYPSGLSLCLSVDHFCLVPVDDMVLFHGMICDGWLVSSGHVLHRVVNWSRCPTNTETLSLGNILQLCRVRSFYITVRTNWMNLFNTTL